jgi:hypothetical protein
MPGVRTFLISLVAGLLIWVAICLVAIAHQPAQAGSVVAMIENVAALILSVVACVILRLR